MFRVLNIQSIEFSHKAELDQTFSKTMYLYSKNDSRHVKFSPQNSVTMSSSQLYFWKVKQLSHWKTCGICCVLLQRPATQVGINHYILSNVGNDTENVYLKKPEPSRIPAMLSRATPVLTMLGSWTTPSSTTVSSSPGDKDNRVCAAHLKMSIQLNQMIISYTSLFQNILIEFFTEAHL